MRILGCLAADRSGNTAMILAGGLSALMATASLGIDAGAMFLEKRRLQGIADAAAMAAVDSPANARALADGVVAAAPGGGALLAALETGSFSTDASVAPSDRFRANVGEGAVRAIVTGQSPSFFARALGLPAATPITARATAARIDLAAFSIGSRLVGVQGGAVNAILSALAGSDLRLNVLDYQALASGHVDLFRFVEALRTQAGLEGASFAEVLATDAQLPRVLGAMADAADDPAVAATLRALVGRVAATPVRLGDLIDLGPSGSGLRAALAPPVAVDAIALLRAVLELSGGARQVSTDLDLGIPGLASTRLRWAVGQRSASSPWLSVGRAGQAVVRTSQARFYLDAQLAGAPPLGLGPIRVPLLVELAPAEARLTAIACTGRPMRAAVTLQASPSVGRAAIADIDTTTLADFGRSVVLRPAALVRLPLVSVSGQSELRIGAQTREVRFDADTIAAHGMKTVSSDDLTASLVGSLVDGLSLNVAVAGFGLNAGVVTAALTPVLQAAAPGLDLALSRTLAIAGVGLGQADLWVDGARCGTPMLVG